MAHFRVLLAPVIIPVTLIGACGGLLYGSYDLTLSSLSLIVRTKPPNECSRWERASSLASGIGLSTIFLYGRSIWFPPPLIEPFNSSDRQPFRFAFETKHILKHFPYRYAASSAMLAGIVTGAAVAIIRRR
jgi:hypothetical protein